MSDPTIHHDPRDPDSCDPDPDVHPDIDLVPGDPPVPITVWRTPAGDGAGMSARLSARLLAAYTRGRDVVYDATGDALFARAVDAAGRRYTTGRGRSAGPDDPAALVLTSWPLPADTIDPVIVLGGLGRRLRRRGVLAVVVTNPAARGAPVEVGPLVSAAHAARLSYLQHIVAVHARVVGDHVAPTRPTGPGGDRLGHGAHLRVHTDLLMFTRAGDHRD